MPVIALELGAAGTKPKRKPVKVVKRPAEDKPTKKAAVKKPLRKARPAKVAGSTRDATLTKKTVKKIVKKADLRTKRGRSEEADALAAEVEALQRDMPSLSGENQKQLDQYVHMFNRLQEISIILEEKIISTKTSRDVYPLMQTYNQMREVIADMRALRDVGAMGAMVNEEVMFPFMQSIAARTVEFYKDLSQEVTRITADNPAISDALIKVVEKHISGLGAGMRLDYQQSLDKSLRVLGG